MVGWYILGGILLLLVVVWLLRVGVDGKHMLTVLRVMMVLAIGLLAFVMFYPFPSDVDAHNLQSGMKNAYTMVGSVAGVGFVYLMEKKYVDFSTEAVWWAQILKAVLGFGLVLAVKEGLRSPLEALFGDPYGARLVRYFLIVLVAGLLWPMSFRFFSGLGRQKENAE